MGRLLILLLIVGVGAWWIYHRVTLLRARNATDRPARPDHARTQAQEMVSCAHCGVHLPRAEAVHEAQLHYCGDAHRRLGPRT